MKLATGFLSNGSIYTILLCRTYVSKINLFLFVSPIKSHKWSYSVYSYIGSLDKLSAMMNLYFMISLTLTPISKISNWCLLQVFIRCFLFLL